MVGGEKWPLVPAELDADPLADQKGYGLTFRTDGRVGIDEGASRGVHGAQRVTECGSQIYGRTRVWDPDDELGR